MASMGATAGVLVLVMSGYHHLRHPHSLSDALFAHGVRSKVLRIGMSSGVSVIEVTLAVLAFVAVWRVQPAVAVTFAIIAALFAVYSLYAIWLLTARPESSCGCSGHEYSVNLWVPLRAAALSGASAVTALGAHHVFASSHPYESVISVIAGAAWGFALWVLPDAMAEPMRSPVELVHEL